MYYQVSLRGDKVVDIYLEEYFELLKLLKGFTGIDYSIRRQSKFNSQSEIPGILKNIVKHRETIGPILQPQTGLLRMRVACPKCGLTDKRGIKNKYFENKIRSYCPKHGFFETFFDKNSERFEYNTPLRNLIRAIVYSKDNQNSKKSFEWIRVTGSDFSGYYQEQLLYRSASLLGIPAYKLPQIVYAPLILDWSGAKLSKSLYVKKNAYKYLPQYLVNYSEFKKKFGEDGLKKIFMETISWLEESYKLFRSYSIYYLMEVLEND